jgi:hypothetical protein
MKHIQVRSTLRHAAALLITMAIIGLSAAATHTPAQKQSSLTLKNIRTDKSTTFYANQRTTGAWFVEAVYGDARTSGAWFVEAVLATDEPSMAKSVAATL